ncbi:MAG TPA: transposase, partial [Candidatus Acidoferrales bacterium]|nr:transposase [Candidatus Acidoferrales bacterium]
SERLVRVFCGVRRLDAALLLQGRKRKLAAMTEWAHSPTHRLEAGGAYMVTAGTYQKQPFFSSAKRLTYLHDSLLHFAARYGWRLEAWTVFPNHYHFIAISPKKAATLPRFISHLHTFTAKEINRDDEAPGRKVWFQYWDSRITYQRSYLARLSYVHSNAVRPDWCAGPRNTTGVQRDGFSGKRNGHFTKRLGECDRKASRSRTTSR